MVTKIVEKDVDPKIRIIPDPPSYHQNHVDDILKVFDASFKISKPVQMVLTLKPLPKWPGFE